MDKYDIPDEVLIQYKMRDHPLVKSLKDEMTNLGNAKDLVISIPRFFRKYLNTGQTNNEVVFALLMEVASKILNFENKLTSRVIEELDEHNQLILNEIKIREEYNEDLTKLYEARDNINHLRDTLIFYRDDTLRGISNVEGGSKGGRTRWGPKEEKEKEWDGWQKHIDNLHKKHPKMSYNGLCRNTAKKYGKHKDTIKRRTENPLKK